MHHITFHDFQAPVVFMDLQESLVENKVLWKFRRNTEHMKKQHLKLAGVSKKSIFFLYRSPKIAFDFVTHSKQCIWFECIDEKGKANSSVVFERFKREKS